MASGQVESDYKTLWNTILEICGSSFSWRFELSAWLIDGIQKKNIFSFICDPKGGGVAPFHFTANFYFHHRQK